MTKNQILYQELLQTKRRDEVNAEVARGTLAESARHNVAMEGETERHNREVEQQAWEQLTINSRQAAAAEMNAESNRMNAETNRLNYAVNVYNAESQRISAKAAQSSAAAAWQNAQTNMRMADIAQYNAETERAYKQAQIEVQMMNAETERTYKYTSLEHDSSRISIEQAKTNIEARKASNAEQQTAVKFLEYLNNQKLVDSQIDLNRAKRDEAYARAALAKIEAFVKSDANTRSWIQQVGDTVDDMLSSVKKLFDLGTELILPS